MIDQDEELSGFNPLRNEIKRLSFRLKTMQPNGLLLHHSRPDHSSYISVYISNSRLMLTMDNEQKIRIESHFKLNDGVWHSVHILIKRDTARRHSMQLSKLNPNLETLTVIDDHFLYRDRLGINKDDDHDKHQRRGLVRPARYRFDHVQSSTSQTSTDTPPDSMKNQNSDSGIFKLNEKPQVKPGGGSAKVLYLGGVEDKYLPLLRRQQIPTNFHGCLSDVVVNDVEINLTKSHRNQGVILGHCTVE